MFRFVPECVWADGLLYCTGFRTFDSTHPRSIMVFIFSFCVWNRNSFRILVLLFLCSWQWCFYGKHCGSKERKLIDNNWKVSALIFFTIITGEGNLVDQPLNSYCIIQIALLIFSNPVMNVSDLHSIFNVTNPWHNRVYVRNDRLHIHVQSDDMNF